SRLAPHLEPGCTIVGLPGQSAFEIDVNQALGSKLQQCVVINLETFPWICQTLKFGQQVAISGIKRKLEGTLQGDLTQARLVDPVATLQSLLGDLSIVIAGDLCWVSISASVHPVLMYRYWRNWDGQPLPEPPPLYREVDAETGELIDRMNAEILATHQQLVIQYPEIHFSPVLPPETVLGSYYGEEIGDRTNITTLLRTNPGYRNLLYPMIQTDGGYLPDFNSRLLTEDIPFGLVIMRGAAEVAGIKTPVMDEVLSWCQEKIGKEYLVDSRFVGKDLKSTRCTHQYGFKDLLEIP
ncbi:MAG: hypothetical protein F6K41_37780, partial [Symploca sp. SIO3E6]|nr:hypothetical protein [Caldora sp. SIO3E6]